MLSVAHKSIEHPEVGKLKLGNVHPDDPRLKYCLYCKQFKDKLEDFTPKKANCKKCRNVEMQNEYWDNPSKRKYHVEKQREYTGGATNPTVVFDEEYFLD